MKGQASGSGVSFSERVRRVAGKGLQHGGSALSAQGQVDSSYRSYEAKRMIRNAPREPYDALRARGILPDDIPVVTDPSGVRDALGHGEGADPVTRALSSYAASEMAGQIERGENAMYVPSGSKGALLLPPMKANPSVVGHEVGHARAAAARGGPGAYAAEVMRAKLRFPRPRDMFSPGGEPGRPSIPDLEREAWAMAPSGSVDRVMMDTALRSYDAQRAAHAKAVYGSAASWLGRRIAPKDRR